jgi:hypothetical protein
LALCQNSYLIFAEYRLIFPEAQAPQPDHNVHHGAYNRGWRILSCRSPLSQVPRSVAMHPVPISVRRSTGKLCSTTVSDERAGKCRDKAERLLRNLARRSVQELPSAAGIGTDKARS